MIFAAFFLVQAALFLSFSVSALAGKNDKADMLLNSPVDFQNGLNYYVLHQQGYESESEESYFDLAKVSLKKQALSSDDMGKNNVKWQSMFLLGDLLQRSNKPNDHMEAVHWLSLCKMYNPNSMDCAVALAELYTFLGNYDKAHEEYLYVVTSKAAIAPTVESSQQFFWGCSVPQMVTKVLLHLNATQGAAKYVVMQMVFMSVYTADVCELPKIGFSDEMVAWASNATTKEQCSDVELSEYLLENGILFHPCEWIRRDVERRQQCGRERAGSADALTQELVGRHEAMGPSNLLDIVHHVYGGDSSRVFRSDGAGFKVLFAGVINPKDVYLFLRQLSQLQNLRRFTPVGGNPEPRVSVHVIAEDDSVKEAIEELLTACEKSPPTNLALVSSRLVASLGPFDYIDYRGGISFNEGYSKDISQLETILAPDGVIAITGFSDNAAVNKARELLSRADVRAHPPFSEDPAKPAAEYLGREGYGGAAQDVELLHFISSSASGDWRKSWTVAEMLELLAAHGLEEVSFLPLLARNPYDSLQDQPFVQKWKSLGLSEADFVAEFVAPFRYTVYASKRGAALPGRPDLLADPFTMDTVFLDRSQGALGEVFSGLQSQPGAFEALRVPLYAQFKLNSDLAGPTETVSLYLSPDAVAGLSLLPSSPTLHSIYRDSMLSSDLSDEELKDLVFCNLINLVRLRAVTVWRPHSSIDAV